MEFFKLKIDENWEVKDIPGEEDKGKVPNALPPKKGIRDQFVSI